MKRLKHLLWIIPSLGVLAILTVTVLASNALDRDSEYHQALVNSIQVRSDDFEHLEEMPVQFSCTGDGISPHIEWTVGPERTRSYALIATDWDAPSPSIRLVVVPHWILFNVPASLREIPQDVGTGQLSAENIVSGVTMGGAVGYLPPCPLHGRHQYQFRVYALDVDTLRPESNSRSDVLAAMEGHILAYGELIGLRTAG
jgi:Raf kinase inhibitor-like YbhB/YbcL family protein